MNLQALSAVMVPLVVGILSIVGAVLLFRDSAKAEQSGASKGWKITGGVLLVLFSLPCLLVSLVLGMCWASGPYGH